MELRAHEQMVAPKDLSKGTRIPLDTISHGSGFWGTSVIGALSINDPDALAGRHYGILGVCHKPPPSQFRNPPAPVITEARLRVHISAVAIFATHTILSKWHPLIQIIWKKATKSFKKSASDNVAKSPEPAFLHHDTLATICMQMQAPLRA